MYVCLGVFFACVTQYHPIPDGIYRAESEELLEVRGAEIYFHIREAGDSEQFFSKWYPYMTTGPSQGKIYLTDMTSAEAAFGVGGYRWSWNGRDIVRVDRKTNEETRFALESYR